MKTYYLTPAAENDLIEIVDYIASDSPAAAGKLLDRIEERFQSLAEMPESGVPREELASGLRSAAIGRYVAFTGLNAMAFESSASSTVRETSRASWDRAGGIPINQP